MPSVWILNHYAQTPAYPGGTRHYELARRLVQQGFDVTVVASAFHHATRKQRTDTQDHDIVEMVEGVRFVWLRSRAEYVSNGAARVRNMVEYACRAWWGGRTRFARRAPRPDVVLGSSPHLLSALAASRLARRFRVPFVLEVRDLWPETIVEMGVLPRRHPLVVVLGLLERHLYRRAARIVSLLPAIGEYLGPRGISPDKVVMVPNGVDLEAFACDPLHEVSSRMRVVYVGAHGTANGLGNVLAAAGKLVSPPVAEFHFYGEGPEKAALICRAKDQGLNNVSFHPVVTKAEVPRLLCAADVLLLNYARIGIGKYGISPNKLWEYLASGRPVVFAHEASNNPVADSGCGLCVPPDDPGQLAAAIRKMGRMALSERQEMGANGVTYVRERHDWNLLAQRMGRMLMDLVSGSSSRSGEETP